MQWELKLDRVTWGSGKLATGGTWCVKKQQMGQAH